MLLQNNCINNGVTNGLKWKKENKYVKQLYMVKYKRGEKEKGECLIGAHMQSIGTILFN